MATAIILGAGKGERMGEKDKAFLLLDKKPLLIYSMLEFEKSNLIEEIVLVLRKDKIDSAKKIITNYKFKKVKKIISGGTSRQDSAYNGLNAVENKKIILIHDVARPLINQDIIKNCIENAQKFGATIPVIPIKDTIKKGKDFIEGTLNREKLNLAQTPQVFEYKILKKAHDFAKEKKFFGTDDASLVEKLGHKIKMINGAQSNIKITTPEDIIIAESLLREIKK